MRKPHLSRNKTLRLLDGVKIALFLVLIVMFINFNRQVAVQSATTQKIATSTNNVVKGQADILKAIKSVTDDTHTTAAQQTAIIICMLQVPISQRTTDLQAQCRASANVGVSDSVAQTTQNSSTPVSSDSSTHSTPSSVPAQSNTSQSSNNSTSIQHSPGIVDRLIVNPIKSIINAL